MTPVGAPSGAIDPHAGPQLLLNLGEKSRLKALLQVSYRHLARLNKKNPANWPGNQGEKLTPEVRF